MREIDEEAVLIVASGYSSDPVIANYQQYGFNGAIAKPFDVYRVGEELRRVLPMGDDKTEGARHAECL